MVLPRGWEKKHIWMIDRAKQIILFENTNEATAWIFEIAVVWNNFWSVFQSFQSTWVVFRPVFCVN